MQDKSKQNSTFLERLESLKASTGQTWEEIGQSLGLSRSSIHLLKIGHHPPTKAVLQRLTEAEVKAGLRKSTKDSNRLLVDYLLSRPPDEQVQVSAGDVDAGSRLVEVRYKRGVQPEGYEDRVLVHAPQDTAHAARLWVELLLDEDLERIVLECLDPRYSSREFLKLIDPRSFMDLAEASLALTLGVDWRKRFPGLAKGISAPVQNNQQDRRTG